MAELETDCISLRKGMMNRIGWFTYLRLIFENVPHVTKNTVWSADFLAELVSFQKVPTYFFFG